MVENTKEKRAKKSLTKALVDSAVDGLYSDDAVAGLRLRVRGNRKSFFFRRMVNRKRYELGLGSANVNVQSIKRVALKLLSMTDDEFLEEVKRRKTPLTVETKITFVEVTEQYFALLKTDTGTSETTFRGYYNRVRDHVTPFIGKKPIDDITPSDVAGVMQRIWHTGTAPRICGLISRIYEFGRSKGYTSNDNPANLKGALRFLLPKHSADVVHHGALPLERVPEFCSFLYNSSSKKGLMFLFAILTASRSAMVRKMTWNEVDFEERVWTIHSSRMKIKANGSFEVPLSRQAIEILKSVKNESDYVFVHSVMGELKTFADSAFADFVALSNENSDRPWIDEEQTNELQKTVVATQHGISRACFRTWATDDSNGNDKRFDKDIAELCLHHAIKDANKGAYARGKFFKRRSELMQAWADFCFSEIVKENQSE